MVQKSILPNYFSRTRILSLLAFSILFGSESDPHLQNFDSFINKALEASKIAGMGLSIISSDAILFKKAYGYSDIQSKEKFTLNTIMNIASISKTTIGVSITYLIEKGLINLDDNVNNIIPFYIENPHSKQSVITLRNLMSHCSGIIDRKEIYLSEYHYGQDSPVDLGFFLENYLSKDGKYYSHKNFSKQKPEQEFLYSNIGSALVAYIVEIISGKPFNVFTKEIIFDNIQMPNTYWFLSDKKNSPHSKLYTYNSKEKKLDEIELYGLTTYPDGGLRSSINDITKYFQYFVDKKHSMGEKIISDKGIEEMFSADYFDFYSNFWNIGETIGHGGGDPGVSTGMYYKKKEEIGYIYLINTSEFLEIEAFEETIINFGKYLKSLNSK